jgi:signal peptidase II
MRISRQQIIFANIFLLVVVADRALKLLFISRFNFELNPGIALSLFNDSALAGIVLNLAGIILVAYLFLYKAKQGINTVMVILFSLVFAGGLANIADRLLYGGVIDYIRIGPIPTFNLADLCISLGVLGLVILSLKHERSQNNHGEHRSGGKKAGPVSDTHKSGLKQEQGKTAD